MRQRTLIAPMLFAALLATAACDQKADIVDIPTAKAKSALALSAFECSHLAANDRDASRLFNVGLLNGREFLRFADNNATGYKSIETEIDPIWSTGGNRPSADFKLGEINAASLSRVLTYRGRWNDDAWSARRDALFAERNCGFLGNDQKSGPDVR